MKTIFFLLFFVSAPTLVKAQLQSSTATYHMELVAKSERQYKNGMRLLITGASLTLINWIIPSTYNYQTNRDNTGLKTALGTSGSLAILVSIPFFLESGSNGRTAAKLSLVSQALHQPIIGNRPPRNLPALTLKIPL